MAYDLGIVIPVYRSRESVKKLVLELEKTFLPDIKIRICLVDDSNDEDTARYLMENCLRPEVTLRCWMEISDNRQPSCAD